MVLGMPGRRREGAAFLAAAALLAFAAPALAGSGQYVAMGSSYAAGPGVGERAPGSPAACARSADDYAHVLADWRGLDLTDVSCSGATTHDILSPSGGLPAQVDAVTAATELVTVLIGGNDVGYIATLLGLSCQDKAAAAGTAADQARTFALHARLTAAMAQAAGADGVAVLPAAALSVGHDVCSAAPWVFGYSPPPAPDPGFPRPPYHPNGRAMALIALALDRMLYPQ